MSLKIKYFLFIAVIHGLIAVFCFLFLKEKIFFLFLSEFVIIFSLFLSYQIYRQFIRPIAFLQTGTDALLDQDFNVKFLKTGAKEMDKLIEVYNQMIDNLRQERILAKEQHYFLQKLIKASPSGIILLDYDGKIVEINPKALKILGCSDNKLSLNDHLLFQKMQQIPVGTSEIIATNGVERLKCEVSSFLDRGFQRKFIVLQSLSKEILEVEKQAYGQVIRMMAHEVNNSIGAINSILESVNYFCEEIENKEVKKEVKDALQVAIHRNVGLNQFMKNFASVVRLPLPVVEPTDLNDLLTQIARLIQPKATAQNVRLELDLATNLPPRLLDPRLMEQAILNILQNALEALDNQGIIRITTTANSILIANNGEPISPEIADRLFTPFFSTKPTGQGVGLTLVREIILRHEANYTLATNPETGWTTFAIVFL